MSSRKRKYYSQSGRRLRKDYKPDSLESGLPPSNYRNTKSYTRAALWAAIFMVFLSVGVFHLTKSFYRYPEINVTNFPVSKYHGTPGETVLGGEVGLMINGLSLGQPLADFENAFNSQLEQQNDDRTLDYQWAAAADFAGMLASLFSVYLELVSGKEHGNPERNTEGGGPDKKGPTGREPKKVRGRAKHEADSTAEDGQRRADGGADLPHP